jgi:hypothetical protein
MQGIYITFRVIYSNLNTALRQGFSIGGLRCCSYVNSCDTNHKVVGILDYSLLS